MLSHGSCPRAIAALRILAVCALLPASSSLHAAEGRAFWITRWNANDEDKVRSAIAGLRALGANTVFVQVYGDSMALFDSSIAPASPLLTGGGDPLAAAVDEGRRRGVEVHAWMNVLNVYSGGLGAPSDPAHIVRAHPEWSVVDSGGGADVDAVGTPDTLIFFCPERDDLRARVTAIAVEIATRYDVDGIHLDYLRFPGGAPRCFCALHRQRFRARFGREPSDGDPDFIEWRYANITNLFGQIHDALEAARPEVKLSASLITPTGLHYQDARRILEAGNLDIAVPMLYTTDLAEFERRALTFHEGSGGRHVYAGILSDGGVVFDEATAARRMGLEGLAFFSWNTLDGPGRDDVAALLSQPASPPTVPWKDGSADTVAPVISQVRAAGFMAGEATILWHSDEPSSAAVEYGRTQTLGQRVEAPGLAFDHKVRVKGLGASTRYYFRASSTDGSGNVSRSATASFVTSGDGPFEAIVDDGDPGFSRGGSWSQGSSGGGNGGDYLFSSAQPEGSSEATFRPYLPRSGEYEVSVWYVAGGNRTPAARYTIRSAVLSAPRTIDQRAGGGAWNVLGTFSLPEGDSSSLFLSNASPAGSVVIADAARFALVRADGYFLRGDANDDAKLDISDGVAILAYLFVGGPGPRCIDAADADDTGAVEITDAIFLLGHLFSGSAAPPPPWPVDGADPTEDALVDCPGA